MPIKIAVDGPAGAGKSTISKLIAKELGILYIDTGAMYRSVALFMLENGVDTKDEAAVTALLDKISIDIKHNESGQLIFLNGRDVTGLIRTPEVSIGASNVAVIKEVRLKLVDLQREIAKKASVIMDGRDIGTYVLTDAEIKIFLTASVRDRARRRFEEMCEKGEKPDFDDVLRDMEYRDKNDSSRAFAPLKAADDAILVDTTGQTLEESVKLLSTIVKERL